MEKVLGGVEVRRTLQLFQHVFMELLALGTGASSRWNTFLLAPVKGNRNNTAHRDVSCLCGTTHGCDDDQVSLNFWPSSACANIESEYMGDCDPVLVKYAVGANRMVCKFYVPARFNNVVQ